MPASLENWGRFAVMLLIVGFVLHQLAMRNATVQRVVTAAFGA